MTIIATFSNGFTDIYKGHRNVKAAWVITRNVDGKVIASGHSLDRTRAAKTARGAMSDKVYGFGRYLPTYAYPGVHKWFIEQGYDGPRGTSPMMAWARKKNAERLARIEEAHTVEIIDI